MSVKLRPIPTVLAIGLVLCAAWVFHRFREPKFQGKPLSAWLQEARENDEMANLLLQTDFDSPSARALRAMGTDCLPALLRNIRIRQSGFREEVRKFAEQNPWIGIHPQRFEDVQAQTALAFAVLGPIAKPAVPQLIKLLNSDAPEVRFLAAFSLAKIGRVSEDVVPAISKFARQSLQTNTNAVPGPGDELVAAYSLNQLGDAARPALAQIQALTNAANVEARSMAEAALLKLTRQGLPLLIESLSNADDSTNLLKAARILRWAGTNGAPAVPILIGALQHTNQQLQEQVAQSLGGIHSHPELSIPALVPLLRSTNGFTRWHTLEALRLFKGSPIDPHTISELISCLQDGEEGVRKRATNALRSLAPEAAAKAGVEP